MRLPSNSEPELKLPTEKKAPVKTIEECISLIYGEKKIGKTSLLSKFKQTLFLMFEEGGRGLEIYQQSVRSWEEFVKIIDLLESDTTFDNVVVDTIDEAYGMCMQFVCDRDVMDHPSDQGYGKGWKAVDVEFRKQFLRLQKCGKGNSYVSHAGDKEFQSLTGRTYNKTVPTMSTQASRFIVGCADILGYYGYYGKDRYLTIRGSDEVESGHRLERQFISKTGERVHSIPMGKSADEAYENFMKAFNNEQEDPCDVSELGTGISEKAKTMKK